MANAKKTSLFDAVREKVGGEGEQEATNLKWLDSLHKNSEAYRTVLSKICRIEGNIYNIPVVPLGLKFLRLLFTIFSQ